MTKVRKPSIYAASQEYFATGKQKNKKNQKKLKKVVDIWEGWCYYNQVAAIRQRQKLKETQQITEFFKN